MKHILNTILKAIECYTLEKGVTPDFVIINDNTFELLKKDIKETYDLPENGNYKIIGIEIKPSPYIEFDKILVGNAIKHYTNTM